MARVATRTRSRVPAAGSAAAGSAAAGRGAILLAAMSWGAVGPAMALLPPGASPMTVAASRIGIGAAGFLPIIARRPSQVRRLGRDGTRRWLLAAVAANVITHVTFIAGLALAGVAVGAMIHMGLCPVFTAIAERCLGARRFTGRWAATSVLAVGGCSALALGTGVRPGDHFVVGVIAATVSSAAYSFFTVCSARVIRSGHCSHVVMATVFCGTAVGLAPFLVMFSSAWVLSIRGGVVVLFLGVVATSGAYCLFGYGLRHLSPSTAATLVLAEPATATVIALAVLGERFGWIGVVGLVGVFAALAIESTGGTSREPGPVAPSARPAVGTHSSRRRS